MKIRKFIYIENKKIEIVERIEKMLQSQQLFYIAIIVFSIIVSMVFTKELIPFLIRIKAGQNIREEGPKSHQMKAGTPSMGGLAIIGSVVLSLVLTWSISYNIKYIDINIETWMILLGMILFGLIGFIDDYTKILKKRNLGLTARQKLMLQILFAFLFAFFEYYYGGNKGALYIPIYGEFIDLGLFFIPFSIFVIVAMVNSVNLTDGIDGLAASNSAIVILYLGIWALQISKPEVAIISFLLGGAIMGFLFWNYNPAKIFMGDTGSLGIGGAIAMIALSMEKELFLITIGIVFVIETLSVIIQVASFKLTGKRVFKMSPIHHHFELLGMSEKNIVYLFALITIIGIVVTHFIA